jgi:hypothetical protein
LDCSFEFRSCAERIKELLSCGVLRTAIATVGSHRSGNWQKIFVNLSLDFRLVRTAILSFILVQDACLGSPRARDDLWRRHCCPNPLYVVSQQYSEYPFFGGVSEKWKLICDESPGDGEESLSSSFKSAGPSSRRKFASFGIFSQNSKFWIFKLQVLDFSLTRKLEYVDDCRMNQTSGHRHRNRHRCAQRVALTSDSFRFF